MAWSPSAPRGWAVADSRAALAATAVLGAVFAAAAWSSGDIDNESWTAVPVLLANTLPLLLVHRNPLLVVLWFGVAYPLWVAGAPMFDQARPGHLLQSLPTLLGLYAVGAARRPLWWRGIALVVPAWMMVGALSGLWPTDALELSYVAVVFVAGWVVGVIVANRRFYAEQLEAKAAELAEAHQALADRAVADERTRLARELHDVIAHAMSVITVQAGVGAHLLSSDPAHAGNALTVIERTGREAMSELRRMLYVLRDDEQSAGAVADGAGEPQPGLADLPSLVAAAESAGVVVTVELVGQPGPLPAGLDLTVYRLVQEALTNVAKHAPHAHAYVCLRYLPDQVTVQVCDRGRGPTRPGTRAQVLPGHGLRGMAERVALYDGSLDLDDEPDGFRVTATFPLEATARPAPP